MSKEKAGENQTAIYTGDRLIDPEYNNTTVTSKISNIVLHKDAPAQLYIAAAIGLPIIGILGMSVTYLFLGGTGIWGLNVPVAWGFAIINFVWWIGI